MRRSQPGPAGLYDPRFEHDACGVSFVVDIKGRASRRIVDLAIGALCNLEHRGATGAEPDTGDGAGILLQVPDRFLREVVGFPLPPAGHYARRAVLPARPTTWRGRRPWPPSRRSWPRRACTTLGWRDVPVEPDVLGESARQVMPVFRQLFVADPAGDRGHRARPAHLPAPQAHRARGRREAPVDGGPSAYFPSLSARTLVYKGMLTTPQLGAFFPDLTDERVESALALVHSRFSTNTFPSWPLAHPYRFLAHNGEINTVQGNRNWMRAREALLSTDAHPGRPRARLPDLHARARPTRPASTRCSSCSTSAAARLPHAVLMMIPEAWEHHETMDPAKRAFYRFHASLMEPWDGPASIAFTDGTVIGAVLDRNGLRPSRYWVTDDDLVIMASEVGVIDVDPAHVVQEGPAPARPHVPRRHRAGPHRRRRGDQGRRWPPSTPTRSGCTPGSSTSADLPEREHVVYSHESVLRRQQVFGYTHEELKIILAPMAQHGLRAHRLDGHRHADRRAVRPAPPAVRLLPAALRPGHQPAARRHPRGAGHRARLDHRARRATCCEPGPASCRQVVLPFPIIDNDELAKIIHINARRRPGRVRVGGHLRPLPRGRRRPGPQAGPRQHPHPGQPGHRRRRPHHRALRPQRRRGLRAHPVAAAHVGRAPPPDPGEDPDQGRPGRRGRRRPRGAPHGAARRLRRRRHQPLPGLRVDRGHDRGERRHGRARARRDRSGRGGRAATSRPPARACSR